MLTAYCSRDISRDNYDIQVVYDIIGIHHMEQSRQVAIDQFHYEMHDFSPWMVLCE